MATVTGLTADRMLAIEAASVVDGDVDTNGNLILTQHGGGQINAGSVIGPQGPQGPVGSMLPVVTAQPILDVGVINQIRAGRQLSPADFGNMGLSAPLGLWNLSDLSDVSGNGRALSNKGAVPFTTGINGIANTAAQFVGSAAQALYIPDTGAADPFRIKTGSFGCWFKTAVTNVTQYLFCKFGSAATVAVLDWSMYITNSHVYGNLSDGTVSISPRGSSNVCDNYWHFAVVTHDGSQACIYVDSVLEGTAPGNPMQGVAAPLNIGGIGADGSTATSYPVFGFMDEAFITADVLSEDQVRNLYCAKISHTNGATPARFTLNVRRRRRGAALAAADFPTQPLRLYNFSAGSLGDEGSNAVALTSNPGTSSIVVVAGADGSSNNAYSFAGTTHAGLSSTDAGLPNALAVRSYGAWFKVVVITAQLQCILAWGTLPTNRDIFFTGGGSLCSVSGGDQITGPIAVDGLWHFGVVVVDNGALDGVKRKLYMDGRLVGGSAVNGSLTPAGANHFRIGADADGTLPIPGQIDAAFVCDYALTSSQIAMLYAKSSVTLSPSPKNPGDHIEGADANNLYATFDNLESNYQVDLKVAS